jgi:surfeit locus 1 family protein
MLVILLGLGTWQVQRLHWKQQLLATIDARIHNAPAAIATLLALPDANYRPAIATGTFRDGPVFYLLGISLTGEGGYHVLTPMDLPDGRMLLIDRGWIPYDRKQNAAFAPAAGTDSYGTTTITGILRLPEAHWSDPNNDPARNNWYSVDLTAMAQTAHVPAFTPYVLEADATPNAGVFPVGGQTRMALPNNHFVYAVTWYGLAAALLVIYFLASVHKKPSD